MRLRIAVVVAIVAVFVSWGAVARAQDHAQHYVLDAFGGVHATGGAPAITPATPYFGFDVAATIEYIAVGTSVAVGDGYIVLDKWGGVHYGGALAADPPSGVSPYFGFDAARSIVRRDAPSRIAAVSQTAFVDLGTNAGTFTTLTTVNIIAPIDGWLHVTGTSYMACLTGGASNNLTAELAVGVDSTTAVTPEYAGYATWTDCSTAGYSYPTRNQTVSAVVAVTAGLHEVNLLGRNAGSVANTTGTVRFVGRSVTAEFIAQDSQGGMSLPEAVAVPGVDPSVINKIR